MKRALFSLLSVLFALMAVAQDKDKVQLTDLSIKPGETKEVSIELINSTEYIGFQLDVLLPEGLSFATYENEDEEEVLDITLDEDRKKTTHVLTTGNPATGGTRIIVYSTKNATFKGTSGALVNMKVTAAEDMAGGEHVIKLTNILFSNSADIDAKPVTFDNVSKTINVVKTYNISATSADTSKGTVELKGGGEAVSHGAEVTAVATPQSGYAFVNWTVGETVKSTEASYTFSASENVALVANFKANQYDVIFDVDGTQTKTTQDFGSVITKPEDPKKEGHTFAGWDPEFVEGATVPVDGITYKAVFTVNTYKVTYLVDGVSYKTIDVKYNETIPQEAAPTKEGHTFSGWSEIPERMPAHDVEITGSFAINSYTLQYVVDETVYHTETLAFGAAITPKEHPTKEGYIFSGWSEIPETMPAKDVTITGKFTFDYNADAYKRLNTQIADLQKTLDEAKNTIAETYKDVAGTFETQISDVQKKIDALTADVKTKYEAGELTAESTIDTQSVEDDIDKLLKDAKAAQEAFEADQAKWAANEAANTRLNEQIATVQAALDAAKTTIATDCPNVASQFNENVANIQAAIDALAADVKAKYEKVELTESSTIDTAAVSASIEQLLKDAEAAQKKYEDEQAKKAANEAAYTRLNEQIATVQAALNAAKDTIAAKCPDVASQFDENAAKIQTAIDALTADVKAKYEKVELTESSTIDTAAVSASIEQMLKDAEAAQKKYEEELAEKKAANDAAYARLTAQIAAVQDALNAAKDTIAAKCPDVASKFNEDVTKIQTAIDALTADVKAKNEKVELTESSTVDTATISASIEQLLKDAEAAQKAFEADQAKWAANEDAHTRLTAQIAAVQDALDAAKDTIATKCPDVATQFNEDVTNIQAAIDALSADVKAKYEKMELNESSTVDTATISATIEQMLKDAEAAQKKYEEEQAKKAANDAAYARLTAQIAAVQDALDAAKDTIAAKCPDVATQFNEDVANIQAAIDALTADVEAKNEKVELTESSTVDTATISATIEQLLKDAEAAQKKYEEEQAKKAANDAAYARLTAQIAAVQDALDAAKDAIAANCPDVASQFDEDVTHIQAAIDALTADVEAKNEKMELNESSTVDTATISATIEQLLKDAEAAQKKYEEEVAEKKAANDAAYARLTAQIAAVQDALDAAKDTIAANCPDVASQFDEDVTNIQAAIDALTADVEAKNEKVELNESSTVDTATISATIEQMLKDAEAAQKKYETEEGAKKKANEDAFNRLKEQLAAVQDALNAAKDSIDKNCPDVAYDFSKKIADIQAIVDSLSADIKNKYDKVELNESSTVDTASISASIEQVLKDAAAAQKAYEDEQAKKAANEAAYTRLNAQIRALRNTFGEAQDSVETNCPDVASQFSEEIAAIQAAIDALSADIKAKYDKVELTDETTIDTTEIAARIEALLKDAAAAQKAYEEEQAKEQANKTAYNRLKNQIIDAQALLNEAMASIESDYPDVADQFDDEIADIEAAIDSILADVEDKFDNVELDENSTVDTSDITASIEQLMEDVKAAQEAFERAKKEANEAAYARLTKQIAELQAAFEEVKETIYTDCSDVASDFSDQITGIQLRISSLKTDVKVKYDSMELTDESTIDAEGITAEMEALLAQALAAQEEYDSATAVASVDAGNKVVGIYTLQGKRVDKTVSGQVYIFRYADGTSHKRMVK